MLDKKRITADAKSGLDIELSTRLKLQHLVALWDEQTKKRRKVLKDTLALQKLTREKIQHLDMNEINRLLYLKWIQPVTSAILAMPDAVVDELAAAVRHLAEKYALTYCDIERELAESQQALAGLVDELSGDDFAIEGLRALVERR